MSEHAPETTVAQWGHHDDCSSCGEEMPNGECLQSDRSCGHHCNHSWSHDSCCWCQERPDA